MSAAATAMIPLQPVVQTRELITVCAWCRSMQTQEGFWVQPGSYEIDGHATHGICPACKFQVLSEHQAVRAAQAGEAGGE